MADYEELDLGYVGEGGGNVDSVDGIEPDEVKNVQLRFFVTEEWWGSAPRPLPAGRYIIVDGGGDIGPLIDLKIADHNAATASHPDKAKRYSKTYSVNIAVGKYVDHINIIDIAGTIGLSDGSVIAAPGLYEYDEPVEIASIDGTFSGGASITVDYDLSDLVEKVDGEIAERKQNEGSLSNLQTENKSSLTAAINESYQKALKKLSDVTQNLYSNIALKTYVDVGTSQTKAHQLLGTALDGTIHTLIELAQYGAVQQVEVGSETIHLNLNNIGGEGIDNHITVDTHDGDGTAVKLSIAYLTDVVNQCAAALQSAKDYADEKDAALRVDALIIQPPCKESELPQYDPDEPWEPSHNGYWYQIEDFDVSHPGKNYKGTATWHDDLGGGEPGYYLATDNYGHADGVTTKENAEGQIAVTDITAEDVVADTNPFSVLENVPFLSFIYSVIKKINGLFQLTASLNTMIANKLNIKQAVSDIGKAMIIGEGGVLTPGRPALLADNSAADAVIGNRTLEDQEGSNTLVPVTSKEMTGWLQGIRNNLKALFSNKVDRSGDTMTGGLNMDGHGIAGIDVMEANALITTLVKAKVAGNLMVEDVKTPTKNTDAANKAYVDTAYRHGNAKVFFPPELSEGGAIAVSDSAPFEQEYPVTLALLPEGARVGDILIHKVVFQDKDRWGLFSITRIEADAFYFRVMANTRTAEHINEKVPYAEFGGASDAIDMGDHSITHLAAPADSHDAVNKRYVDDELAAVAQEAFPLIDSLKDTVFDAVINKGGAISGTGNEALIVETADSDFDYEVEHYLDGNLESTAKAKNRAGVMAEIGGQLQEYYILPVGNWEALGVDLTNYYTKAQTDAEIKGAVDGKVNKSGDTMSGSLNMGDHGIGSVGTLSDVSAIVAKNGGLLIKGRIEMDADHGSPLYNIENVKSPVDTTDAANKQYVDTKVNDAAATLSNDTRFAATNSYKLNNTGAGTLIDLGEKIASGRQVFIDAVYDETYGGNEIVHAQLSFSLYGNVSSDARNGVSKQGFGHMLINAYHTIADNGHDAIWIPKQSTNNYPSVVISSAYKNTNDYGTQPTGTPLGISVTTDAEPDTTLTQITNKTDAYYSTTERFTGEYWTDGKPVYIRAFEGTITAAVDTESSIQLLTGVSDIVAFGGTFVGSTTRIALGSTFTNSATYGGAATGGIQINTSNGNAFLVTQTAVARNAAPYKVWAKYTKV